MERESGELNAGCWFEGHGCWGGGKDVGYKGPTRAGFGGRDYCGRDGVHGGDGECKVEGRRVGVG